MATVLDGPARPRERDAALTPTAPGGGLAFVRARCVFRMAEPTDTASVRVNGVISMEARDQHDQVCLGEVALGARWPPLGMAIRAARSAS
jgi:hypothetical protein